MSDDWFDFLVSLVDADAAFLVIGAHALAMHATPRATQDLDVWVNPTEENAKRVWNALASFGAPIAALGITREDFTRHEVVVQIGLPPNRIDVLTSISGVADFDMAWNSKVSHEIRGRSIPFLGRAALIQNKLAAGRKKDLADVEALGE